MTLHVEGREVASCEIPCYWSPINDVFAEGGGHYGLGLRGSSGSFDFMYVAGLAPDNRWDPLMQFEGFGETRRLMGVDGDGIAYIEDGAGGFCTTLDYNWVVSEDVDLDPDANNGVWNAWRDYIPLAWETGGAAWSVCRLEEAESDSLTSFSTALASLVAQHLDGQASLDLVAPECPLPYDTQWLKRNEIKVQGSQGEETHQEFVFDVSITGDGHAHFFDLEFRSPDGNCVGSIPVQVHVPYVYDPEITDPDGDEEFTFAWSPGWQDDEEARVHLDTRTGRVTWDPQEPGPREFSIIVFDGHGGSATRTWTVTASDPVSGTNQRPTIVIDPELLEPDQSVEDPVVLPDAMVRHRWTYPITATDPDDNKLSYYLVEGPQGEDRIEGLEINRNTGELTWTPLLNEEGTYTFYVRVEDGFFFIEENGERVQASDVRTFTVDVVSQPPANRYPVVSYEAEETAYVDEVFTCDIFASDKDPDTLEYHISGNRPDGMAITKLDNGHARVLWTPSSEDCGFSDTLRVSVTDGRGGVAICHIFLEVAARNSAPELVSLHYGSAKVGQEWTARVFVRDPNGDPMRFYLDDDSLDAGIELVYGTQNDRVTLRWTPTEEYEGTHVAKLTVQDAHEGETEIEIPIFIACADAPEITYAPPAVPQPRFGSIAIGPAIVGDEWEYVPSLQNAIPDGSVSYSVVDQPPGMNVVFDNGRFVWTPSSPTAESQSIRVAASYTENGESMTVLQEFLLAAVTPTSTAYFDGEPAGAAVVGKEWTYTLSGIDPDGDNAAIQFALSKKPDSAYLDGTTLKWIPDVNFVGTTAHFEITLTDDDDDTVTQAFDLPVLRPYVWTVGKEDQEGLVTVVFDEAAASEVTVTLDAESRGRGMSLQEIATIGEVYTYALAWEPESAGVFPVEITATDAEGRVQTLSFEVQASFPLVPRFTSLPTGPAVEGDLWDYTITGTDPDNPGVSPTIEVTAKPASADFNPATGVLSWTPGESDGTSGHFEITLTGESEIPTILAFDLPVVTNGSEPAFESIPCGPARVGETWRYSPTVTNVTSDEGTTVTFSVHDGPAGMEFVGDVLTWTPPATSGRRTITAVIRASYTKNEQVRQIDLPLSLFISDAEQQNHAPVFHTKTLGPIERDCKLRIPLDVRDPDGHAVTNVRILPEGTTIPDEDDYCVEYGVFEWTPEAGGYYRVQFSATDEFGAETQITYGIYVIQNAAPRILMDYPSCPIAGEEYVAPFTLFDPNDEDSVWVEWTAWYGPVPWPYLAYVRPHVEFELAGTDYPVEMVRDDCTITWTPSVDAVAGTSQPVTVSASYYGADGDLTTLVQTFNVEITDDVSDAWFLTSPSGPARPRMEWSYTPLAYDPRTGEYVTEFEVVTKPQGAVFDEDTGTLYWTPAACLDEYVERFEIRFYDAENNPVRQVFDLPLGSWAPSFASLPCLVAPRGKTWMYDLYLTDLNGITNEWEIYWKDPRLEYDGAVSVAVEAGDRRGGKGGFSMWGIPVLDPERPIPPDFLNQSHVISAEQGFGLELQMTAFDGITVQYSLDDTAPEGVRLGNRSGKLTWTPTIEQAGTSDGGTEYSFPVMVEFRDAKTGVRVSSSTITISLTVVKPEDYIVLPLEIVSQPPSATAAGEHFTYQPATSRDDTRSLRWDLLEKPDAGMTIDVLSGQIDWDPDADYLGETVWIVVGVCDPVGDITDVQTFPLIVQGHNSPPVIMTTFPATWASEEDFSFEILAQDPEGHTLNYEVFRRDTTGDEMSVAFLSIENTNWIVGTDLIPGDYDLYVRVTEIDSGLSTEAPFHLIVEDALTGQITREPIFIGNPHGFYASIGHEFSYDFEIFDLDDPAAGIICTVSAHHTGDTTRAPANAPQIVDGRFTWTPTVADLDGVEGGWRFTIFATDTVLNQPGCVPATATFEFTLTPVDNAPPEILSTANLSPVLGTTFWHEIVAIDPEQEPLRYSLVGSSIPEGMLINPTAGVIRWEVPSDTTWQDPGDIYLVVTDSHGLSTPQRLNFSLTDEDTVAPSIKVRVLDADGNVVLPGEELDAAENYTLLIYIYDNLGYDPEGQDGFESAELSVVDVAGLQQPSVYYALGASLGYGINDCTINNLNQGNIFFKITATDEAGNEASDEFSWYVSDNREVPFAKLLSFCSLSDTALTELPLDSTVTEPVEIIGTADMDRDPDDGGEPWGYELRLCPVDDDYSFEVHTEGEVTEYWVKDVSRGVVIASGVADSVNAHLGTLDPTLFKSGLYRLVLQVVCEEHEPPHIKAIDERIIEIRNDARPGNLDLSFTDLQTDLGGIPISLVRSYCSADVDLGEATFGPGWSLNLLGAGVEVGHFKQATNSLSEPMARGTRVFVTLPDGSIQRFTFDPVSYGDLYRPYFRPDPDNSTTLEIAGIDDDLLLKPLRDDAMQTYQGPYQAANSNDDFIPHRFGAAFVLRTWEGVEYHYDLESGELIAIANDAGTRIAISPSEDTEGNETIVLSSSTSSKTLVMTFDTDGRITALNDGTNSIAYAYGPYADYSVPDGDVVPENLHEVTLRDGTTVRYEYHDEADDPVLENILPHHLTGIYDNAGVKVLAAEYHDENDGDKDDFSYGHLESLADASGAVTGLALDMDLGGGISVRTIDSPSGLRTKEMVNSRGDLLRRVQVYQEPGDSETDKFLITVYDYEYDDEGRLTWSRESAPFVITDASLQYTARPPKADDPDAIGVWERTVNYDSEGRVTSSTNAAGRSLTYRYDDDGRLVRQTDLAGNITRNIYDPTTGLLLESYTRDPGTLLVDAEASADSPKRNHMVYEYDHGRLVRTYKVDAEDDTVRTRVSTMTYDGYGRVATTTDAFDVTQYMAYDYNGNKTHTWKNVTEDGVPVVLVSVTEYDFNDRVTATKEYKLFHSEVTHATTPGLATILAGATPLYSTTTSYTHDYAGAAIAAPRGLVYSSVDRYGIITGNFYDTQGNLVQTATRAWDDDGTQGWLVTRTVYDDEGRVTHATDPFFTAGDPTSDDLDDVGRLGTHTVYDPFGREIRSERVTGLKIDLSKATKDVEQEVEGEFVVVPVEIDDDVWSTAVSDPPTVLSATHTVYDDPGRVESTTDEFGTETQYFYDVLGRQVETRYQSWDENGTLQWIVTRTVYDADGRARITTDPFIGNEDTTPPVTYPFAEVPDDPGDGVVTRGTLNEYDASGRIVATHRIDNLRVLWVENAESGVLEVTEVTDYTVLSSTQSFYDAEGRLEYTTDEFGTRTEYFYDALGRQVETRYQTRDESGDLQWIVTRTVYDSDGRVWITTDPFIGNEDTTLPLTYPFAETPDDPSDGVVTCGTLNTYDAYGRVIKTERIENLRVLWEEDAESGILEVTAVEDYVVVYSTESVYDDLGRLARSIGRHAPGETGPATDYFYDGEGRQEYVVQPLAVDDNGNVLQTNGDETNPQAGSPCDQVGILPRRPPVQDD